MQLLKFPEKDYLENLKLCQDKSLYQELQNIINYAKLGEMTQPQDLRQEIVEVQKDDLIICGTDGFFDNICEKDLEFLLNQHKECDEEEISFILCKNAWEASQNSEYDSPFAQEYRNQGTYFMGGKPDDVTVITSKVYRQ